MALSHLSSLSLGTWLLCLEGTLALPGLREDKPSPSFLPSLLGHPSYKPCQGLVRADYSFGGTEWVVRDWDRGSLGPEETHGRAIAP